MLDHAAQSPALNPLENIWCAIEKAHLGMSLYLLTPIIHLKKIQEVWDNYPTDELQLSELSEVQIHIDAVESQKIRISDILI